MSAKPILAGLAALAIAAATIAFFPRSPATEPANSVGQGKTQLATFGGGCFWCTEAVFEQLKGVVSVKSGYSGGWTENPTYRDVCNETTGHAEVIQIEYDPSVVTYKDLLAVFFQTHDPTTRDRQGADVGRRYRSVILYRSDEEKRIAEQAKTALDGAKLFPDPIVTEIAQFTVLYPAENYHQDYFAENPAQPYCQAVIRPKLAKLHELFRDKIK